MQLKLSTTDRMWYAPLILIGLVFALFIIYNMQPTNSGIINPLDVQGIRIRVSLDEIFNKIIPSQKVDIVAILSSSKELLWSDTVQIHLSSEYYNKGEYILILRNPTKINTSDLSSYENDIRLRLEYILKRYNVFVALTDKSGNIINSLVSESMQNVFILASSFLFLAVILYIYFKLFKRKV